MIIHKKHEKMKIKETRIYQTYKKHLIIMIRFIYERTMKKIESPISKVKKHVRTTQTIFNMGSHVYSIGTGFYNYRQIFDLK